MYFINNLECGLAPSIIARKHSANPSTFVIFPPGDGGWRAIEGERERKTGGKKKTEKRKEPSRQRERRRQRLGQQGVIVHTCVEYIVSWSKGFQIVCNFCSSKGYIQCHIKLNATFV